MNGKKICIILLFVLVLFSTTSSVSANDMNNSDVDNQNALDLAIDDTLAVSDSFSDLNDEIQKSASGATIVLDRNYTYVDGDNISGIAINKNLTIDGRGYTLNGDNKASIFHIFGNSKVILQNINFINAYGTNGSAVSWTAGDSVNVIGSKFINNVASANGAAIYISSTSQITSNSMITNSSFINNNALNGGAVYVSGTVLNIVSSNFNINTAQSNGGSLFLNHGAYIDDCTFTGSHADISGGAMYINSSFSDLSQIPQNMVDKIGIFNSQVISSSAGRDGGAGYIYSKRGTVCNVTVINCTAGNNGGAGYIDGDFCSLINTSLINNTASRNGGGAMWSGVNGTIQNCLFINNKANSGDGGGLYLHPVGDVAVSNTMTFLNSSTFNNNTAGAHGGGLYCGGIFTVIFNSQFTKDKSFNGAGIYLDVGAAIGNCTFVKEHATYNGGAIYLSASNTELLSLSDNPFLRYVGVADSSFIGCSAGYDGGAGYVAGNYGIVRDVVMVNNTAGHDGGAGYIAGSYGRLYNSSLVNNFAARSGGALAWEGNYGYIQNVTGVLNRADGGSGSVCIYGSDIQIRDSTFSLSNSTLDGGAIYVYGDDVNITNSLFDKCAAKTHDGGAIYVSGLNTHIYGCNFTMCRINMATGRGGAINVQGDGARILDCYFDRCTAFEGGFVYINGTDVLIDNVVGNRSFAINGGAFYVMGDNATISNAAIANNNATTFAGAIYVAGDFTVIDNVHSMKSIAYSRDGGAIYVIGLNTTISNSSFVQNIVSMSGARGGAINVQGDGARILDCYFDRCTAFEGGFVYINGTDVLIDNVVGNRSFAANGGAFYVMGDNATISNSTITNNNATAFAGAIYVAGDFATVDGLNFVRNIAYTRNGGAIYIVGLNTTISNSNFVQNIVAGSTARGGAIDVQGDFTRILNCTFDMCTAFEGGVVYINGSYALIDGYSCIRSLAHNNGGAIYVAGDYATIADFNISLTNATNYGGAIYVAGNNADIHNSNFTRCIAIGYNGGALYVAGVNTTISKSNFVQNRVTTGRGGSIDVQGDFTRILNCTFDMCTAFEGGVVYINGSYALIDGYSCIRSLAYNNGGAIYVMGDYATISNFNISLTNATNYGGALYVAGDFANITNSNFTKCIVDVGDGGAVYISGLNASISKSRFTQNKVNVSTYGRGGSINIQGDNAFINDCIFEMCTAWDGGVIYINGSNVLIDGYSCTKSLAFNNGGAIYVEGDNAKISNFNMSLTNSTNFGGALYIAGDYAKVYNSNFSLCTAYNYHGGAVYIAGLNSTIAESNFIMNKVNNGNGRGGSIDVNGNNTRILNCTFDRCNAYQGGVIYINGSNVLIDGYSCNRSFVTNDGGAIYVAGDYVTISNFNMSNANATGFGGAVYVSGDNVNITNSNFTKCISYTGNGGGIYVAGLNATISESNFVMNMAVGRFARGGSIDVQGNYTNIYNCTFDKCNAYDGGVIYINGSYAVIDGYSCIRSLARNNGGAIYIAGDFTTISNFDISLTNATNYGGAMYISGNYTNIFNSNFARCIAANYDGGALYVAGLYATISNSNFVQNKVNGQSGHGGSIEIVGNFTRILNSTFDMCNAYEGGIIHINGSYVTIDGFSSYHCIAFNNGGTIYVAGDHVLFSNFNILMSNATNYGGAIYVSGDYVNVSSGHISQSIAVRGNGGSIYLGGQNIHIQNCIFDKTLAPNGKGGSIFFDGDLASVVDSDFTQCFAHDGGAIAWMGDTGLVNNCNFTQNNVNGFGGALFLSENVNTMVNGCNFADNIAKQGGAIYWNSSSSGNMANCVIVRNVADQGSAIYIAQNCLDIVNSTLLDNRADSVELKLNVTGNNSVVIIAEFKGNDNLINAIWNENGDIGFRNVTYWGVGGVLNTGNGRVTPIKLDGDVKPSGDGVIYQTQYEAYQNITCYLYDGKNNLLARDSAMTNASGVVKFSFDSADNNVYELVYHPQDSYYTGIEESTSKKIVYVDISAEDINYLENESVNVNVISKNKTGGLPTGSVEIYLNDNLIDNITLADGKPIQITLSDLNAGTYNLTAKYLGDDIYLPMENATTFKVFKLPSFIIPTVENYNYGESGIIHIKTINQSNTVYITLNNQTYSVKINESGYGQFIIPELDFGKYEVDLYYPELENYLKSTNSTTFEIYPIINVNIVKSVNLTTNAYINGLANYTIIVSNDGQIAINNVNVVDELHNSLQFVSFGCNATDVGLYFNNGIVTSRISSLDSQSKVLIWIVVRLLGNGTLSNFAYVNSAEGGINESNVVNITVDEIVDLTINKTVNTTTAFVGDEIEYVITVYNNGPSNARDVEVTEKLSKYLSLTEKTTEYGYYDESEGIWHIGILDNGDIATLTLKARLISVAEIENEVSVKSRQKDSNESNNNCTCEKVIVVKRDSPIESNVNDIRYGEDEEIIISLPKNADGAVNITVNGHSYDNLAIDDGIVKFTLSDLAGGNYDVEISYGGDDKYKPNSTSAKFSVARIAPEITIEVVDILEGETEVLNVTVNAPGSVNITVGNVTVEIPLEDGIKSTDFLAAVLNGYDGRASWNLINLAKGKYPVFVSYNENENYTNVNATDLFYVKGEMESVEVVINDISVGEYATIEVKCLDDATGNVSITITDKVFIKSLENGMATFDIPSLKAGTYTVGIAYGGDDKYLPFEVNGTLNVLKLKANVNVDSPNIRFGDDGVIIVSLDDDAAGTITIEINGKIYTQPVEDGGAIFVIPGLSVGKYEIVVYYSGDDKYLPTNATTNINVGPVKDKNKTDNNAKDKTNGGITLSDYATGNPIIMVLIILLSFVFSDIRKFKI